MNPLEQLQPLIAPPPIAWWPPAPGWWLLAVLLLAGLWALWKWRKQLPKLRRKKVDSNALDPLRLAALSELALLNRPQADEQAGPWLQQLNALLKRLCREHYPTAQSHTLNGRAWLAFLDSRCPAAGLTRWMVLVDGPYRPRCSLTSEAAEDLQKAVDTWIRKHV